MIGSLKSVAVGLLFLTFTFSGCSSVAAQDQPQTTDKNTCSISGRVRVDGKPIAGVVVELLKTDPNNSWRKSVRKVTTDKTGSYVIKRITSGSYDVSPTTPSALPPSEGSYSQSGRSVIVDPGENLKGVDFDLVSSGSLSGQVSDVDGNPVAGEYVSLILTTEGGPSRPFSPAESANMLTDETGHYHIVNVPPGRYRVGIGTAFGVPSDMPTDKPRPHYQQTFHPDVADETKATVVEVKTGRETMAIDITVPRPLKTYDIFGQVVEIDSGKPVPNVGLGLITRSADGRSTNNSTGRLSSDYEGRFKISSAAPGHYVVYPENDTVSNTYGERIEFDVKDQDVKGLKIDMRRAASISGVVTLNEALALDQIKTIGLYAYTQAAGQGTGGWPTRVGGDGLFRITGVRPGKVSLSLNTFQANFPQGFKILRVERNGVELPQEFEVGDRENVTGLRVVVGSGLENCVLRGQVKSEGGPLEGVNLSVYYRPTNGEPGRYTGVGLDMRGRFAISGLAPGEYELMVGPMSLTIKNEAGSDTMSRMQTTKQTVVLTPGSNAEVTMVVTLSPKP